MFGTASHHQHRTIVVGGSLGGLADTGHGNRQSPAFQPGTIRLSTHGIPVDALPRKYP
ncbi:hypothetical protein QFZ84_000437 [Pseudomonas fluorescens]